MTIYANTNLVSYNLSTIYQVREKAVTNAWLTSGPERAEVMESRKILFDAEKDYKIKLETKSQKVILFFILNFNTHNVLFSFEMNIKTAKWDASVRFGAICSLTARLTVVLLNVWPKHRVTTASTCSIKNSVLPCYSYLYSTINVHLYN